MGEPWCAQDDEWQQQEEERGGGVVDEAQEEQELPSFSADKRGQTDDAIPRGVTGINKTTDGVTLTYDPWGSACLDNAVGELECQGCSVAADREGVSADNGGGDSGEVVGEEGLGR